MFDWIKIGVVGGVIALFVGGHFYLQNNAVNNAVIKVEDSYKLQLQIAEQKAITSTANIYKNTIEELNTKNENLNNIASEYKLAIDGLRNRKARPSETVYTTVTEVRETCTGSQLFREDAEFLTGEAARAEAIVVERDFYYQRYEDARLMLEELRNK